MKNNEYLACATRVAAGALILGGVALAPTAVCAQAFPTKPVTISVGFPPAGPLDWMARVAQPKLQEKWGQQVIVENRPGAGGMLAVQYVQKAPPDGHVLTPHTQQVAMIPLFAKQADIEPGRNLQPLGTVFATPYVIVGSVGMPFKNLREFIAHAKANPGKLNAAAAAQTGQQLDTLALLKALNIDVVSIPYKGGNATFSAVLANESQMALSTTPGIDSYFKANKLIPLATTSAARSVMYPDIPTVKEVAGLDFVATIDFGYYTTQGTPRPVVEKLTRDIAQSMDSPDIKAQVLKQGFEPTFLTTDEWLRKTAAELKRSKEIAQAAGIKPE